MKKKLGRPKQKKHQIMTIRLDTNAMILDWQAKYKEKYGIKISKIDIIHIAVQKLAKNGLKFNC